MTAVLALNDISCELDDRVLFSGMCASFESGDLVQIVGPNGAGKTTLLKILTGLSRHYEGTLSWSEGGNEAKVPSYEFYCALLFIGHHPAVKASLTPRENLSWYFGLNGRKGGDSADISTAQIVEALANVGLAGYEDVPCFQMSAGQQRRVALARLYISKARLWILDEPFTAIDKQGVARLEQQIESHRQAGGIVVLTTHQSMTHAEPKLLDLANFAGEGS